MIYRFLYQNPPKATRHASIASTTTPKDLSIMAKAAYANKYGTLMEDDGYSFFAHSAESADVYAGDPGTGPDPKGPEPEKTIEVGPKPSIVDYISWGGKVIDEETKFYDGDEDKYQRREEAKKITAEAFEDIDRPDRYLQGEIDLIDAAYLLFPWDQFKGFMKITIMRYTLRYEHKGWLKDLDKITVYTRRLKELEVKNKEREDRKNEK